MLGFLLFSLKKKVKSSKKTSPDTVKCGTGDVLF